MSVEESVQAEMGQNFLVINPSLQNEKILDCTNQKHLQMTE